MKKIILLFLSLFFIGNLIAGSSQCAHGSDGSVSCGGKSLECAYGSNGSVSCGGQSSQCAYGSNEGVSCGGRAHSALTAAMGVSLVVG